MPNAILDNLSRSIDRSLSQPLYDQLSERLEVMIRNGDLKPRDRLPTVMDFAENLQIHHRTVSRALEKLVNKRLLISGRRVGTYVSDRSMADRMNLVYAYPVANQERMVYRIECLQQELQSRPLDLKVFSYDENNFDDHELLDLMHSRDTAGGILVPFNHPSCFSVLKSLEKENVPYVRFGNYHFAHKLYAPTVTGNDAQGLYDALDFLHNRMGHEKIGYLCRPKPPFINDIYFNFLHMHTGYHEPRWLEPIEASGPPNEPVSDEVHSILRDFVRRSPELTAVIVTCPSIFLDFLQIAREEGRTPGEDLSLIALHDWPGYSATSPPITSMAVNVMQMVEIAMQELDRMMTVSPKQRYSQSGQLHKAKFDLLRADKGSVKAMYYNS